METLAAGGLKPEDAKQDKKRKLKKAIMYVDKQSKSLYRRIKYLKHLIRLGRPEHAKPGAKDFDAPKLKELQAELEETELKFAARRRQATLPLITPCEHL